MRLIFHSDSDLIAETEAGITWMSGAVEWRRLVLPVLGAVLGVAFAGAAEAGARIGMQWMVPLWWTGLVLIFAPAARALFFSKLSRNEAVTILLVVGFALYCVKLLYAPGALFGYDELLHYRTLDDILTTRHLFAANPLLPVSPYYPGMEAVTATLVELTGLSAIQAGLVLIGVVRLLSVLAVFLLLERIAEPSRFAAPATLLYMACPAFLYFDSMFSYESLALALSLVALFVLAAAQDEEGWRRQRYNLVAAALVLAVVVTHHVTSFILAGALAAWTIFQVFYTLRARRRAGSVSRTDTRASKRRVYLLDLPGSLWVPILSAVAVALWLFNVAELTISYLEPQLRAGLNEAITMIYTHTSGRTLFESPTGHGAGWLERGVGIGSVAVILVLIPVSIKYLWERRHSSVLSHFFAIGALGYPAILALRLTQNGWDVGSRATAFVYLPLAFTVAAGLELLVVRRVGKSRMLALGIVLLATLVFAGGIVAGSAPITRLPSAYNPGVAEVPYDRESLSAAAWAASDLGPGNRFAADSAGGALVGSIGRQQVVASSSNVSISALFLRPTVDDTDRAIIKAGKIDYAYVDRRIAGSQPLKGFIYEKWERQVWEYGSAVSTATVDKFSLLRDVSKEFDSGDVQVYELHRLVQ